MAWADMRELANEHNFILVYPQGTPLDGVSHWGFSTCRWGQQVQQMILDLSCHSSKIYHPHIVLMQTVFMPVAIPMGLHVLFFGLLSQ